MIATARTSSHSKIKGEAFKCLHSTNFQFLLFLVFLGFAGCASRFIHKILIFESRINPVYTLIYREFALPLLIADLLNDLVHVCMLNKSEL